MVLSSRIQCCTFCWKSITITEEHVAISLQSLLPTSHSFLACFTLQPWRRRWQFSLLDYNLLNSILSLKINASSPKFRKFITYGHKNSKFFHYQIGEMLWNMVYILMYLPNFGVFTCYKKCYKSNMHTSNYLAAIWASMKNTNKTCGNYTEVRATRVHKR